ncbi:MAG: hypothetical protein Kow00121_11340 [Elainellaceae cyanobacterium]
MISIRNNQASLSAAIEQHCLGNLQEAIEIYRGITKNEAQPEEALLFLALANYELMNPQIAKELMDRRNSINFSRSETIKNLGVKLLERNQVHLAYAALEHAVSIYPKNLSSCALYYKVAHLLGKLEHEIITLWERFTGQNEETKFKMYYFHGRDQVVNRVRSSGLNSYETPLPLVLSHCIKAFPGTFLDVGSNSGFFSLLAVASGATRVVAFEAFKPIFELLECNVALNGFPDKICLEEIAISNFEGDLNLYIPINNLDLIETSASLESSFKAGHSQILPVRALTIDTYASQKLDESECISLIKIDVEGHETAVLSGALKTVHHHRPIIFIEILNRADFEFLLNFKVENEYAEIVINQDKALLSEEVQFYPNQYNHILVPNELLSKFISMLEVAGITTKK